MTKWGTYYSKTYKQWLQITDQLLAPAVEDPIAEAVVADVLLAIPKARTSSAIVPVGDGDNYEKAIFDLIQKKGYLSDDRWITTGHWRKRWLPYGEQGFTRISLRPETEDLYVNGTGPHWEDNQ